MPTTIELDPTDLREPVYDVEEIYEESGCPDAAWSLFVTARIFVIAVIVWVAIYFGWLLVIEIL